MYLGSFAIDDYVGIPAATHRFSSGAAYAPTVLTYSIYEEATAVGIDEDVDMTVASPFDSITGCYWVRRQLTAAAGFEAGKNYLVVVKATVDSVAAIQMHTFQVLAKVQGEQLGTQAKADVNAEVDSALNTAIPGSPTADSINERVAAIDGKLPSKAYLTGTANSDGDVQADEATGNFPGTVAKSPATLAAADVSGNVPADAKAWNGGALPTVGDATAANQATIASYIDTEITTILNRLGAITGTGANTVLGFFQALLNKAATIPSDIGGTFDPATDSTEAIRDTAPLGTAMRGTDNAALAATALSNAVWTNTKAGYLDEAISAAKTLTAGERNSIADAHLDRADAIETGVTPRQAHRLEVAASAGVTSGMATANPLLKNPAGTKIRVTATADENGNRTAITLTDLT